MRGMRQHAIDSGAPEAAAHMMRGREQLKLYGKIKPLRDSLTKALTMGAGGALGVGVPYYGIKRLLD